MIFACAFSDSAFFFLDSQIGHLRVLAMSFRKLQGMYYLLCTYSMEAQSHDWEMVGIWGNRDI